MKKNLRKAMMLVVAVVFILGSFAGCGSKEAKTSETTVSQSTQTQSTTSQIDPWTTEKNKGEVNLTMYLLGEAPADQPKVVDEINKYLKNDISATLVIKNIPWADWDKKYQMIFYSGEDFDLAFATSWASYQSYAQKGAFYEVSDENLKTYLPETYKDIFTPAHEYLWASGTVNGKHYMIPQTYDWTAPYVALIRGDLRTKYNIPELKTMDDVYNYAMAIGNKEKGIIPFNSIGNDDKLRVQWGDDNNLSIHAGLLSLATDNVKDDGKVFNNLTNEKLLAFVNKMREMQLEGAYSKSALSSKTDAAANFKAGTSAILVDGVGAPLSIYMDVMKNHPEWKPEIINISANAKIHAAGPFDGGLVVQANSKNPLRALMLIELLRSNKQYNDLLNCGIPGIHYTPVGSDRYTELDAGLNNYPANNFCPWGLNTGLMRIDSSYPSWVSEFRAGWAANVYHYKMEYFHFDDSKVKSEVAALRNIESAVLPALEYGLLPDPKIALEELIAKEKEAGYDKVAAELQAQIDAYLSSK